MAKSKIRSGSVSLTGSGTGTITIDVPRNFVIQQITYGATGRATGKILISDDDEYFVGTACDLAAVFGTGANPRDLPTARRVRAGSRITLELTDLSAATNVVHVAFLGVEE